MKKLILIPGIIGGVIASLTLIIGTVHCYNTGEFEGNMLVGYTAMILAFSMIFVAVKTYRDKYNNGVITFGKAFKTGLLIALVTSTIYVIVWLVCYYAFIPDFMERYTSAMMEKTRTSGASQAEIDKTAAQMQQYIAMYKNPVMIILLTYLEIFPVGLLVSLIVAFILKRKNKEPQEIYTANA